jgi:predicted N-formylglutamate amidohydrolase
VSPPPNDAAPLLGAGDPLPWASWRSEGRSPALLVCDHASAQIPGALGQLGLTPAALSRHIAWDIGAAALTRSLADRLDAPAVLAGYSRLVIDCNRHPDNPSSILAVSDGERIPGNEGLNADARAARRVSCFEPYHAALAAALRSLAAREPLPVLIAVHSFTPALGGSARPWHVGVLWDRDDRVAAPLLEWLRSQPDLVVGDNEPYSGRHPADYTVHRHAASAGLRHVCLEVRQDLISTASGVDRWARLLAKSLGTLIQGASRAPTA